jgi:uncharacterized protein (TIGR03435 family)
MKLTGMALLALSIATGQTAEPLPAFEVASVKRLPLEQAHSAPAKRQVTPRGLTLQYMSMGNILSMAYDRQPYQVVGPDWLNRPTDMIYDIVANAAGEVSESQLKLMLRRLLADRFHMATHRESRELPVYAMVVDKNGPKFHRSTTEGDPVTRPGPSRETIFERVPMSRLAELIGQPWTSRPIADQTGLSGVFDFTLDVYRYPEEIDYSKRTAAGGPVLDMEPAVLQALPQQLGLRLQKKQATVEVLVIDHIEKDPIGN